MRPDAPPWPDAADFVEAAKARRARDRRANALFALGVIVVAVVLGLIVVGERERPDTELVGETPEGCRVYRLTHYDDRFVVCPSHVRVAP